AVGLRNGDAERRPEEPLGMLAKLRELEPRIRALREDDVGLRRIGRRQRRVGPEDSILAELRAERFIVHGGRDPREHGGAIAPPKAYCTDLRARTSSCRRRIPR